MKVLIVGSGGREHALAWAISQSKYCDELYCAPGNAGIESLAECVHINAEDINGIVNFTMSGKIFAGSQAIPALTTLGLLGLAIGLFGLAVLALSRRTARRSGSSA